MTHLLMIAAVAVLLAGVASVRGKEVLPPEAYVNRTFFPPLVTYDPTHMPHLSIGLLSDVQYSDQEEQKRRHFKLSLSKLAQAVDEMNANRTHLDFVVHLGDLVDHSMEKYLPVLQPVLDRLKYPLYQVLGNHDFLMTDERKFAEIHTMLKMPARYYSFVAGPKQSYRFVVLDGNDIALYSTVTGSPERKEAEQFHARLKRMRARNFHQFNGALGKKQIEWLMAQLEQATQAQQRVVVMLHHPMRPKGEPTNLWNDLQIVPIITSYKCVIAVINGHAHKYIYDFHHTMFRTVHFVTFGGMVQSPFQTFGFLDIYEDELRVHGLIFGRAIDNHYSLRAEGDTTASGTDGGRSPSAVVFPTGLAPVRAVVDAVSGKIVGKVGSSAPQLISSSVTEDGKQKSNKGAIVASENGPAGVATADDRLQTGDVMRGPLILMPAMLIFLLVIVLARLTCCRRRR